MPAKPLTPEQKADASRLRALYLELTDARKAAGEAQIEGALKELASLEQQLLKDDIEAAINGGRAPGVVLPSRISSNWARISVNLQHMQALGCRPYQKAIDPGAYEGARQACNRERRFCDKSTWQRND